MQFIGAYLQHEFAFKSTTVTATTTSISTNSNPVWYFVFDYDGVY